MKSLFHRQTRYRLPPLRLTAHSLRFSGPSPSPILSLRNASTEAATDASSQTIASLLIANRGEIALRIQKTAAEMGIRTTAVYTGPDTHAQHVRGADEAHSLGSATTGYLDVEALVRLAKQRRITALHPGYGFLSENPTLARRCEEEGILFVGPPPAAMEAMGNKARSKEIMTAAGVPCVPGYHGADQGEEALFEHARALTFPVLLKSVRGGGGKGMRIVTEPEQFIGQLRSARAEAKASFGEGGEVMLVEKYVQRPRHVEVQVFADRYGECVALGERDCSVQRRHQKIVEESPAPDLDETVRADLWRKACTAAQAVGYVGAGTVEFILDRDTSQFYFMEMNTRLQVEHPVTEMVTGTDLVAWQLRIAAGEPIPRGTQARIAERIRQRGAAIEARIYAEKPEQGFLPDAGRLQHLVTPRAAVSFALQNRGPPDPLGNQDNGRTGLSASHGLIDSSGMEEGSVRLDAGFVEGDVVSEAYDGMIAKLIVRGADREAAIRRLALALDEYQVVGVGTNIRFLQRLARHEAFLAGDVDTGFIEKHRDELFAAERDSPQVFVQAALALVGATEAPHEPILGFGGAEADAPERSFTFVVHDAFSAMDGQSVCVKLRQYKTDSYSATVRMGDEETVYRDITSSVSEPASASSPSPSSSSSVRMTTFFPEEQSQATIVTESLPATSLSTTSSPAWQDIRLHVFRRGRHHTLQLAPPAWFAKVVDPDSGAGEVAADGSAAHVLSPMPCKVLRVEVEVGQSVDKGAPLVVIESMKMETVLRAPRAGVVQRVGHVDGDLCKAGALLVTLADADGH